MIRSVRLTLTFWYIGILAIILILFSGILYSSVSANLRRDIDNVLISQADDISDTVFAFWKAEHERDRRETIRSEIGKGSFQSLISRWAEAVGSSESTHYYRVISLDGKPLDSSKILDQYNLPISRDAVAQAAKGHAIYQTFRSANNRIRLLTWPVIEDEAILYFVQIAIPLKQADASLEHLRLWLIMLVPLTLIVTSAGGWFLATLALRSIGRMTEKVREISAQSLHERLDPPRTDNELHDLAVTFNEMLDRLERSFKRTRQFSAAASHELRTPLTIMKGELEVALRKPRENEEYRRVLTAQLEALNEMTGIVEQLLKLAHSDENSRKTNWATIDLGMIINRTFATLRALAELKNIRAELCCADKLFVRGEALLLERLTTNLLENAVKNTPAGGRINLAAERRDGSAILTVRNTGPGISPDELPKIFDKFFSRNYDPDQKSVSGLGLGLCRWIVEMHQGSIEAASIPNQETVFTVRLPLFEVLTSVYLH